MNKRAGNLIIAIIALVLLISANTKAYTQSVPARNHVKVGRHHLENGSGHLENGRPKQAEEELKKAEEEFKAALKIEATNSDAHFLLGLTYLCQKKLDDAQICFEKVIRQQPKFEVARLYLAQVHLEKKELEKAKDELEFVLKIDPKNAEAYYGLGVVSYMSGNLEKSIQYWKKSIDMRKNYAPAFYNLGIALYLSNRLDESRQAMEKAMKSNQPLYEFSFAWIEYETGRHERAKEIFKKLKENCHDTPIGLVSEGIIEFDVENLNKGVQCAKAAKEIDPKFQKSYVLLGMCLEKMELWEDAIKEYEEVIKEDPNEHELRDRIEKIKEKIRAEEDRKKARNAYPYHEESKYND